MNRERLDIARTVRFVAYDFLEKTNQSTSGVTYKRLYEALRRLSRTRIETNIMTAGKCERSSFGLVDSWRVIERHTDGRMVAIEVTLPDWQFRAIQSTGVRVAATI